MLDSVDQLFRENISAIFGVTIIVLCTIFCLKQWKMARPYRNFPSKRLDIWMTWQIIMGRYPKGVSFTRFIFQNIMKTAAEFQEKGLCVVWLFEPHVMIVNEKYTKHLVNEVELTDRGAAFTTNDGIFGNGLLSCDHESWKVERKLLNPAFSVGVLKGKMDDLNKYAVQLADSLETLVDKPGDDAFHLIKICVCHNMGDFVLGLNLKDEKNTFLAETFMKCVESLGERFMDRLCCFWLRKDFMLPFFEKGREYLKNVDEVKRLIRKVMDELMERNTELNGREPDEDSQKFGSFGDFLMKLYMQDHVLTENDVRDQLVTFVSAAYDTVSLTLLYCFFTLGHHPEVQEKAYSEVQSIVPEGDVTYEDLPKLKYLECVIKETLRLYTTIPLYERKARSDIQCGQYTIPKNSKVLMVSLILHRDPHVFPEPEKFDPERFLDSSKVRPWMYIPFFEGYRSCIGKKFAMMQLKVTLVHVLRRFRLRSLNKIDDNEFYWAISRKPTKPLGFSFENRQFMS